MLACMQSPAFVDGVFPLADSVFIPGSCRLSMCAIAAAANDCTLGTAWYMMHAHHLCKCQVLTMSETIIIILL